MHPSTAVSRKKLHPAAAILLILLSGCIPVLDLGKAWDRATIDPDLEGAWKKTGEKFPIDSFYQSFIRNGDAYDVDLQGASMPAMPAEEKTVLPATRGRTLTIGKHKFLLLDKRELAKRMRKMEMQFPLHQSGSTSGTKSGKAEKIPDLMEASGIQRYAVGKGVLTLYILEDMSAIEKAIREGAIQGQAFNTTLGPEANANMPGLATLNDAALQILGRLADDPGKWREDKYTRVADLKADLEKARTYPAGTDTSSNTTVQVNLPEFQFFCEGREELFRRHLQASPEWHVFEDRWEVVAYRRHSRDGLWREGSSGYTNNRDEQSIEKADKFQIRYKFRFDRGDGLSAPSSMQPELWGHYTQVAAPTAGDVELKLKKNEQGIESILVVGRPGLWFEFFEQANREKRIKTREGIAWLAGFSRDLQTAAAEIEENGYAARLMPGDAIRHGKPSLEVVPKYPDRDWARFLRVKAAVNPGRQGFVYLKAFDAGPSGAALQVFLEDTREYIGWSKHPDTLFPYFAEVRLPEEATKKGSKVRIELWFRPSDGSPSRFGLSDPDPSEIKLLDETKEF